MPVGNKVTRPVPNGRCVDTLPEQGDGGCAPIQLIEAEQDVVGDVFRLTGLLHGVELYFGSVQGGDFEAVAPVLHANQATFWVTLKPPAKEENAHEYGFILRYPKGYKPITGFQYEPWHFRYVGIELANEMKTKGIKTLEEFWELESAPDYTAPAG